MPIRTLRPAATTRATRVLIVATVLAAALSAIGASRPGHVLGASATTMAAACDGVNLRTKATTTATIKRKVPAGTRITVVATVDGGSWKATCAGRAVSGSRWYRISAIGGTSVASLYGIRYLYGATGLFTPVRTTSSTTPRTALLTAPGTRVGIITEGIDVSHWQGAIDWSQVRAAGKRFAYVKATDGTSFVDDRYAINRSGAKAAGLYVGAYHFARPDATAGDAVMEADHFIDTAAFTSGELLPVLDLEQTGGLSIGALRSWVEAFLGRIQERTGVRGVVYVSPNFWTKYLGDTTWFADHGYEVLWVAHWTSATRPTVPAADWGSHGWTFWQYTSDGSVPGISGRVDLDRYRGSDLSRVRIP